MKAFQQAIKFQSTHPRGVRRCALDITRGDFFISIHAPTWGATFTMIGSETALFNFNPRTHVGCDLQICKGSLATLISIHAPTWGATSESKTPVLTKKFQSTHPRGVRHWTADISLSILNFNPRTHVGCDPEIYHKQKGCGISIHAPTWGATTSTTSIPDSPRYFNPRTHVGCDQGVLPCLSLWPYFNPRTHVGCDSLLI